jgi:hypothetical protein
LRYSGGWGRPRTASPWIPASANRTETAARIKYAFDDGKIRIDVSFDPADIPEILARHAANEAG